MSTGLVARWWPLWVVLALVGGAGTLFLRLSKAGRREVELERVRQEDLARAARSRSLESLDSMSGSAFERFVAGLCARDGFRVLQDRGGSGDLGADVIAVAPDGRRIVIQCKRYKPGNAVPGPDMQRFLGTARAVHHADVPVFVTTAWRFTRQSKELAVAQGVVLVHRDLLGHWNNGMSLERFLPAASPGRI